jgi:hypothetical protein
MITRKIRIQEIKDRITAIDCLQEAGQDKDAVDLLRKLAKDILGGLKEK